MIQEQDIREKIKAPSTLRMHIRDRLAKDVSGDWPRTFRPSEGMKDSAVLLALTQNHENGDAPCLVLNKRSAKVRQPGDLCYPGGGIGYFDGILAGFQRLPSAHLPKWPPWPKWRSKDNGSAHQLALLFTTSLRESWEEMRLNPFRVSFLGPLPAQRLVMFQRTIHPMVGWIHRQKYFRPNWEVDRIIRIPLEQLLDLTHYGRYRLTMQQDDSQPPSYRDDLPCFIFKNYQGRDILWGASYHITMSFLSICFDFVPPPFENLPVVEKRLEPSYFNGI